MKKQSLLRIVSAFLVALMLLSLVPVVSTAEEAGVQATAESADLKQRSTLYKNRINSGDEEDTDTNYTSVWSGKAITWSGSLSSPNSKYEYTFIPGYTSGALTVATAATTLEIKSAAEFLGFMQFRLYAGATSGASTVSMANYTVKLCCDIDLGGATIEKINSHYWFGGTFDGQGHVIANFVSNGDGNNRSVFGSIGGNATFKNVTYIGKVTVHPDDSAGAKTGRGIIARAVSVPNQTITVQNVLSMLEIRDTSAVSFTQTGGIIGTIESNAKETAGGTVNLIDCSFKGSILSQHADGDKVQIGGLVGYSTCTVVNITNCIVGGKIENNRRGTCYGGFIGLFTGVPKVTDAEGNTVSSAVKKALTVTSSLFAGELTLGNHDGSDRAGALVGMAQNATITVENSLIAGSIKKGAGTPYAFTAIVASINNITTPTLKNCLVITDLSDAGDYANVFSGLYNGGTSITKSDHIKTPTCTNVYYHNVGTTALTVVYNSGRQNSTSAPTNAKEWNPASNNATTLGSDWVNAGDFVKYPIPAGLAGKAENYLIDKDSVSVTMLEEKQTRASAASGYTDYRFIAVVKGSKAMDLVNNMALGMDLTVSYRDQSPVTQTYYVSKGYKSLKNDQTTIYASNYSGEFFITFMITDVPNDVKDLTVEATPFIAKNDAVGGGRGAAKEYMCTGSVQNLRIMTFNIQNDLDAWSDVISKEERIAAVKKQIKDYNPDILGVQEDSTWDDNLGTKEYANLTSYMKNLGYTLFWNEIDYYASNSDQFGDNDRIYVKNTLIPNIVKDKEGAFVAGTEVYQGSGSRVALNYSDISKTSSPYYMTDAERDFLNVTTTSDLYTSHLYNKYTNAEHTKYTSTGSYATWLGTRGFNYIVMQFGDRYVIYVNTHLQHRSQTFSNPENGYYNQADADNLNSPVQKLKSFERAKSIELLQDYVDDLKQTYKNAEVIVTADMNDGEKTCFGTSTKVTSQMYNAFQSRGYIDTMHAAKAIAGGIGSWNDWPAKQPQPQDVKDSQFNNGRLDYCFVTSGFIINRHENSDGYVIGDGKRYESTGGNTITLTNNHLYWTSDHRPVIVDLSLRYS